MLKSFVYLQNTVAATLRRDDRGATAVEYGLIVALIAGAIITVVATLGTKIANEFTTITNQM